MISVNNTIIMEHAQAVIEATFLKTENANIGNQKNHKIQDARHGIGKSKSVMNAQTIGIMQKEKDVYHMTHYVKQQMTIMDGVNHVIKDMN